MEGKLKVLHLLTSNKFAGAENVVCQIIDMFKKEKDIQMIYCSPKGPISEILKKEKISFLELEKFSAKEIHRAVSQYKPNIVHAHDFRASILACVSTPQKTKIVSHLHHNAPWLKEKNLYSYLYRIFSRRMNAILMVSNAVSEEYIFFESIKHKSIIIGNPISVEKIILKSKYSLSTMLKENVNYDIVFIGRLEAVKDPIRFIEILKKVVNNNKNIKSCIIGEGTLKSQCLDKISELKLNEYVDMLGFLENPLPILKNAKILCITSKWEGYGLVAIEALTLGVPVLATSVGGLVEIIDSSCGKLCNNNDEFANEISVLLTNTSIWNKKSDEAKNKIEKIIKKGEYKDILVKVYNDL